MILLIVSTTAVAGADDYGYNGSGGIRHPDSPDHWYCFRDVTGSTERNRIHTAMGILDDQTRMYDVYTSSCGTSTDASWEFTDWCAIPGAPCGAFGATFCELHSFWGICDRFGVYVDPTVHYFEALSRYTENDDIAYYYAVNIKLSVCHELGHSAGLRHVLTDPADIAWRCMNSAWVEPANGWEELAYVTYATHHVEHIDDYMEHHWPDDP